MINHFMTESDTYSDTLKLEEWMLYGSSRLGSQQSGKIIAAVDYTATYSSEAFSDVDYNLAWKATYSTTSFKEVRGSKQYELSNHSIHHFYKSSICNRMVFRSCEAEPAPEVSF